MVNAGWADRMTGERGLGLVEILLALVVVALAGYLLLQYFGSTAKTVETIQKERPIASSKVAADQATLGTLQSMVRTYHAQHGRYPPDKAAVVALLMGGPRFQCPGNDFEYEPATGALRLLITDPARC